MLTNDTLREMSYAEFAMTVYVGTDGLIKRLRGARNRVITYRPFNYSHPRGGNYPDYCRNSSVKFSPWQGCYANGWGGAEGDVTATDDVDKRQAMVNAWTAFAEKSLLLPYAQRPPGVTDVDLHPALVVPVVDMDDGSEVQQEMAEPTTAMIATAAEIATTRKTSLTSTVSVGTRGPAE